MLHQHAALLLAEMVTWGYVLLSDRRHWPNKLHAYGYIIKNWRDVMASRRTVQSLRRVTDKELLGRAVPILDYSQTGDSGTARLAHLLFDPLFILWQRVMLLVTPPLCSEKRFLVILKMLLGY